MRAWKKIARKNEQELEIAVVPPTEPDEEIEDDKQKAMRKQAEYEKRIQNLLQWYPSQKPRYHSDVVNLCIPGSAVMPKADYDDIVEEPVKVDQIALILIRYNKLPKEIFEKLCFVIPKIDSWDFAALRDGRKELRHLRSRILGIPPEWNVNMADIDCKVSEVERRIALDNPKYAKLLAERNARSLMPFL